MGPIVNIQIYTYTVHTANFKEPNQCYSATKKQYISGYSQNNTFGADSTPRKFTM